MEQGRISGFVVGFDPGSGGKLVWKVRAKDPGSGHDGEKFVVASTHDGMTLAQGLNVNFLLGTVDDPDGRKVVRAVDVRLQQAN